MGKSTGISTRAIVLAGMILSGVNTALASDLDIACSGGNWSLELSGLNATLTFPQPTKMEVMLDTPAFGKDWPRALTLVGDRDTGVLILDAEACVDPHTEQTRPADFSAQLLTQRGQTPIFLTGCCRRTE